MAPFSLLPLVDGPDAGGKEFEKVAVGIMEVDALAAAGPRDAADDLDASGLKLGFPGGEVFEFDGKASVDGTGAVVGRDHSAR